MHNAVPVSDGVYRIAVPIMGIPVNNTFVYVLEGRKGPILIDAGWNDDASWAALETALNEVNHSVSDIEGVVLTHHHPDHSGLAGRIKEASDAWIAMHEADADLIYRMKEAEKTEDHLTWELENLRRAGAGESDVAAYEAIGGSSDMATPEVQPDKVLSDQDHIPLAGRDLRVVWTPGHTAGHICLYLEDADILFAGDHVLSKTTPHVGNFVYPIEDKDPLGDFLSSLGQVAKLPSRQVLPAHEDPIVDIGARTGEIIAHHEDRLDHLYSVLGDDEVTLWQAAERMTWYQPWDEIVPLAKQLALSEAAAHLRHLITRSLVEPIQHTEPMTFIRTNYQKGSRA